MGMEVPVLVPDDDIFDHTVDPARPYACTCGPALALLDQAGLDDQPLQAVIVHHTLARPRSLTV